MNLQTLIGGLAAPGVGRAEALAYASAYLLSCGVEIVAVSVTAAVVVRYVGRDLWNAVASHLRPAPAMHTGRHATQASA